MVRVRPPPVHPVVGGHLEASIPHRLRQLLRREESYVVTLGDAQDLDGQGRNLSTLLGHVLGWFIGLGWFPALVG